MDNEASHRCLQQQGTNVHSHNKSRFRTEVGRYSFINCFFWLLLVESIKLSHGTFLQSGSAAWGWPNAEEPSDTYIPFVWAFPAYRPPTNTLRCSPFCSSEPRGSCVRTWSRIRRTRAPVFHLRWLSAFWVGPPHMLKITGISVPWNKSHTHCERQDDVMGAYSEAEW